MPTSYSLIRGTGSYLPEKKIPSSSFLKNTGLDERGILKRTGIQERRQAHPNEATSDLATHAAFKALESANISPQELDFIILSTTSPDMFFPSTACMVQKNINAPQACAFDISAGCSGFLIALSIADQYLKSSTYNNILVIAAEVKTRFINPADAKTAIIFGDGAGAVVMQKGNEPAGIQSVLLKSDGRHADLIKIPAGGSRMPTTTETLKKMQNTITMKGESLFRVAVEKSVTLIREILEKNHFVSEDISYIILHQANLRLIKAIAKRVHFREDQWVISIDKIGNTSSSSIPITLDFLNKDQKLKGGEWILLAGFGAGLTWGAALIQWPTTVLSHTPIGNP